MVAGLLPTWAKKVYWPIIVMYTMINIENRKFAEFIGIILGDGSIGHYRHYRIKVTLNSNETEYLQYIYNLIKDIFNIKPLIYYKKSENAVDIAIFNKEIFNFLIDKIGLVVAPKKNRALIPDRFLNNSYEKYVLRGYFDSDGCIAAVNNNGIRYPRLEMKICQSPMQQQFIEIIKRFGFRYGCYKIGNGNVRIQINGRAQLLKWYKEIGFSNSKNIKIYQSFI